MGWSLPSLDDKKMQQALTDKKSLPPSVQSVMKDARQSCERLSKQAITVMKKLQAPESTHHVFLCASSIFFRYGLCCCCCCSCCCCCCSGACPNALREERERDTHTHAEIERGERERQRQRQRQRDRERERERQRERQREREERGR